MSTLLSTPLECSTCFSLPTTLTILTCDALAGITPQKNNNSHPSSTATKETVVGVTCSLFYNALSTSLLLGRHTACFLWSLQRCFHNYIPYIIAVNNVYMSRKHLTVSVTCTWLKVMFMILYQVNIAPTPRHKVSLNSFDALSINQLG